MQSDLALLCREARGRIEVPAVPLAAIRATASVGAPRKAGWLTALVATFSIVAVAAGAAVLGTHITFDGSGVQIIANKLEIHFKNPTEADVEAAVKQADFPVTLPSGLPDGAHLKQLWSSDGAIMLLYNLPGAWRASHHVAWIVLANPEAVTSETEGKLRLNLGPHGTPMHWRVGDEEVIIAWNNFTPAEIARMKQAMLTASTPR
jgi:hypothetical protein